MIEQIHTLFDSKHIADFDPYWDELVIYAELDSVDRWAMFLAQVSHECQSFSRLSENLNYSAKGLAQTWPGRYAVDPKAAIKIPNALAWKIARKPEMIANYTYANRMGNGSVESGDGWKFRGRGCMMTTFRNNYQALDAEFNMNGKILANPDMLLTPYWALMSAGYFWKCNNLNALADQGKITAIRKVINGGLIGLADVKKQYSRIAGVLRNTH